MTRTLDVYIDKRLAGTLRQPGRLSTEFVYDESYVTTPGTTPLSNSIPLSRPRSGPEIVVPWLSNLLPENPAVLEAWRSRFAIIDPTPFAYLEHVGADLAGAVQIVPHGAGLPTEELSAPLTEHDLADEIARVKSGESIGGFIGLKERFGYPGIHTSAVAGQQKKFTLTRGTDGHWHLPLGGAPSTHIFKFGFNSINNSDIVEFVTMRAAALLGIPTARTHIEQFEDQTAVVVERFDRIRAADGSVTRVHQEDLVQALALPESLKYESDGGPGISTLASLLRRVTTHTEDRDRSLQLFTRALVFNLLTAGTDAHAKNYALLYRDGRVALAPLYDLNSAFMLVPDATVMRRLSLAMRYGKEYKLRALNGAYAYRNFARVADDLGIDRQALESEIQSQAEGIADAFSQAVAELPAAAENRLPIANYATALAAFAGSVRRHLALPSYTQLPPQPRPPRLYLLGDG